MKKLFSLLLLIGLLLTLTGCPPIDKGDPRNPGYLQVHYIDVGQGDCALIECNGEFILIDGGNVSDSQRVVSYLERAGVEELYAVICTHPHEDHVGGLAGVLAVYKTYHVYAPTRTYSSECFDDFVRYTDQQGLEVAIPQPGDSLSFGGATMTFLGPVKSYADANNTSIVIRIDYGTTGFLFTGDMEIQAENDMLEYWQVRWGESYDWHADVLKVGHHGSETSTGYRFLRAVMPNYGIISVGRDNSYGHPHEDPLSRLEDAGVTLYRTDLLGTIVATSDGSTVTFAYSGAGRPILPPAQGETEPAAYYIGNINSKKLHKPHCASLPAEKNQVRFTDYEEAIAAGYQPCSQCMG